jgi:hypothetical protein
MANNNAGGLGTPAPPAEGGAAPAALSVRGVAAAALLALLLYGARALGHAEGVAEAREALTFTVTAAGSAGSNSSAGAAPPPPGGTATASVSPHPSPSAPPSAPPTALPSASKHAAAPAGLAVLRAAFGCANGTAPIGAREGGSYCRAGAGGDPTCPRVAWLFSGVTRTFGVPYVHKTIMDYAVRAFGGDATIFMYVKDEEPPSEYNQDHAHFFCTPDLACSTCAGLEHVAPDVAEYGGSFVPPVNAQCPWMSGNPTQQRNIAQLHSRHKVWRLLEEFEAQRGFKFDFVVSIRLDCIWGAPLPPWTAWPRPAEGKAFYWYPGIDYHLEKPGWPVPSAPPPTVPHVGGCWDSNVPVDHFGLFHREAAPAYFNLWELYTACAGGTPSFMDTAGAPAQPCCGGGITELGFNAMLKVPHVSSVSFQAPVQIARPTWITPAHSFCSTGVPPGVQGGDTIPDGCCAKPLPGCPPTLGD